jgi:hypothetical protein
LILYIFKVVVDIVVANVVVANVVVANVVVVVVFVGDVPVEFILFL